MYRFTKPHTLLIVSLLLFVGVISFRTHTVSAEIPGAPNSTYPDTSLASDPTPTYMVNEICAGTTNCMRSKTTVAAVYVPQALRGQTIKIVISDGCDDTANDLNQSGVETQYHIQANGVAIANTDSESTGGCINGNGNVDITFTAQPTGRTYDTYDLYYFVGDTRTTWGGDGVYYYNFYRLGAVNVPGYNDIKIGISPDAVICPYYPATDLPSNWTYSCPTGSSYGYSSFGQVNQGASPGGYYGQEINVPSCKFYNMYGRIDLYDLDSGQYSQTNIRVTMIDTDTTSGVVTYTPDINGLNLSSASFAGKNGNNEHLWLPGAITGNNASMYTFLSNHTYTLRIENLTRTNTLQILAQFSKNSDGTGGIECVPTNTDIQAQGTYDGMNCSTGKWEGWALDKDSESTSIQVHIYIDGAFYTGATADIPRGDVNTSLGVTGDHGFSVPIPDKYRYSGHTITVYAIGINSSGGLTGDNPQIASSPNTYPPCVIITGRVYNAYNTAVNYDQITISTCITGVSAKTGLDGKYSFVVASGADFCVSTSDLPKDAVTYAPRPTGGWGYKSCAEFTADRTPNYCTVDSQYNGQKAGTDKGDGIDRGVDTGYDLVFRFPPQMSCSVKGNSPIEAGVANNYTPVVSVKDTGDSSRPTLENGTASVKVTGVGTINGTYIYAVTTRGDDQAATLSPASLTIASPDSYKVDATASGTGDGYGVGPVTCPGSSVTANFYPYVKVYGSDIWAGSSYNTACTSTSGGIYANVKGSGASASGSSGQLGVSALLDIKGFYSSSQKTTGSVTPIKGSTFSNTAGDSTYGGGLGGKPTCLPDYFTKTKASGIAVKYDADFPPPDTTSTGPPYTPPPVARQMLRWTNNSVASPADATFPYCTQWRPFFNGFLHEDMSYWSDNWLCSRADMTMAFQNNTGGTTPPGYTITITEPSDGDTSWGLYRMNFAAPLAGSTAASYFWTSGSATDPSTPAGSVGERSCVQITEPSEPAASTWNDNWICAPYYMEPQSPVPGPSYTVAGAFSAGKTRYELSGSKTINGLSIPVGSQVALYVDGDVYITANITYATGATVRTDLPFLAIIAKGNIYIDPAVDRIDGMLIAQPRTPDVSPVTDGRIYTCAYGLGIKPIPGDIYGSCSGKPFVINGSLIAQQVKFGRTFKSLNDSSSKEAPNFATGSGTNAAEVINFSPELYLAPSPLKDPYSQTSSSGILDRYNAVYTLPPVF